MSLYDVLELHETSVSQKEIKKAYQRLILLHHPDKQPQSSASGTHCPTSTNRFLAIQKAWNILGDPEKRRIYDQSCVHKSNIGLDTEFMDDDECGSQRYNGLSIYENKELDPNALNSENINISEMSKEIIEEDNVEVDKEFLKECRCGGNYLVRVCFVIESCANLH